MEDIKSIETCREEISSIDSQITELFVKRMKISEDVAEYKKAHNLPVLDKVQERKKMNNISGSVPEEFKDYTIQLYSMIFELSKVYQMKLNGTQSRLVSDVGNAIENTPKLFPSGCAVACQGEEGSDAQMACDRIIRNANIMNFSNYDAVFAAVEKGLCRYGIVPLENSIAGSVNEVYDLMQKHKFSIVRSIRMQVAPENQTENGNSADMSAYTRYICISRDLEIYPGADRTSLMVTLPHEQGSLFRFLSRLNALGINLNKLESRPVPGRNFEFMFYFDLDIPVYSPQLIQLIGEMDGICESFVYLGSYSEVV